MVEKHFHFKKKCKIIVFGIWLEGKEKNPFL